MAGQGSLGFGDSLLISVVGMAVVMFELFLLFLFVKLLAKLVSRIGKKDTPASPAAHAVAAPAASPPVSGNELEMTAALVASFAECGYQPGPGKTLVINAEKQE